jgi:hypothetical protein
VLTADEAVRAIGAEAKRFNQDPVKWVKQHEKEIVYAVGVVVAVTCVVAILLLTAGAGLPAILAVGDAALLSSGAAATATEVAGLGTAVTVAGEGTALTVSAAASAPATEIALIADGAGLTEYQLAALRFGIGMREGQAALAIGSRAASVSALSDTYLMSQATGTAAGASASQLSMNMLLPALAFTPASQDQEALKMTITPEALRLWGAEMQAAGPALAALSSHHLIAKGSSPQASPSTLTLDIGKLYLLRLRSQSSANDLPPLEGDFDHSKHSDDLQATPENPHPPSRLKYLGIIRCK